MDWSRFQFDISGTLSGWLRLLRGIISEPAGAFWWPSVLVALVAALLVVRISRKKVARDGLRPFLKELPVDVACLLGHTLTQAAMAPFLLLATIGAMTGIFLAAGVPGPSPGATSVAANAVIAAVAFLCGDFMLYWRHRLFHAYRPLWWLHKLHHQPPVLTPITAFRFWPPETAVHLLAFAFGEGIALGIAAQFVGISVTPLRVAGLNAFFVAWLLAFSQLRHSHVALRYPRWLSYLLVSPHMHQAHHSCDPGQHHKNFGTAFAFWDLAFGTLYVPSKGEHFRFGIEPDSRTIKLANEEAPAHAG